MDSELIVPDYKKLALPVKQQVGGHIIINNEHVADTIKCGHCFTQWVYIKGSGRTRGFCHKCKQITCGKTECNVYCIDSESKIEAQEKGETIIQTLKRVESKSKIFNFNEQ